MAKPKQSPRRRKLTIKQRRDPITGQIKTSALSTIILKAINPLTAQMIKSFVPVMKALEEFNRLAAQQREAARSSVITPRVMTAEATRQDAIIAMPEPGRLNPQTIAAYNAAMSATEDVADKKEGLKKFDKGMKSFFKVLKIGFSGFVNFLEKIGVLRPIFSILNGLLKYFGGVVLRTIMPILSEIIELLMSEDFLAVIEQLAIAFANILIPFLQLTLMALEELSPYLDDLTSHLILLNEEMSLLNENEEELYLTRIIVSSWIKTIVFILHTLISEIRFVVFATNSLISAMKAWHKWIIDVGDAIKSATGGGSSGGGGGGGSHGTVVDAVLDWLGGGQYGIPNVPQTGLYKLHAGERVSTSSQVEAQMRDMVALQEESIDLQRKTLNHIMWGL